MYMNRMFYIFIFKLIFRGLIVVIIYLKIFLYINEYD